MQIDPVTLEGTRLRNSRSLSTSKLSGKSQLTDDEVRTHDATFWQQTSVKRQWRTDYSGHSAASFCTGGDSMQALIRISGWALLRLRLLEFRQSDLRVETPTTNNRIPLRSKTWLESNRVDTDAHPHGGSCRESSGESPDYFSQLRAVAGTIFPSPYCSTFTGENKCVSSTSKTGN